MNIDLRKTMTFQLESFSPKECKVNALILSIPIILLVLLIFGLWLKGNSSLTFYFIPFSFLLIAIGYFIPIAFYHELKDRYESKAKIKMEIPNPVYPLFLLFMVPGICLLFSGITWLLSGFNIVLTMGISLAFFIPLFFIFLRENNFYYDSGVIINEETGKKEFTMGYNPFTYYLVGLIFGLYGYYYGFKVLSFNNNYFIPAIVWILIIFLFQLSFLFPDKINSHLPFELKTFKGFGKYLAIVGALYCLFIFFTQNLILGVGISIIKYLTFQVILNICIYLAFGVIVAKLYYNIFSKKNK